MSTLKSAIQLISPQLGTCPVLTACNVLSRIHPMNWAKRHLRAHPAGDILDPSLWRFYVVSNAALEARGGEQKSAELATIKAIATAIRYYGLKAAIDEALMD